MSGSTFTLRLLGATATLLLASACGSTTATPGGATSPTSAASSGGVLGVRTTSLGPVLVDAKGLTVYLLTADTPGHSSCSAQCLQYWPLVPAPAGGRCPDGQGHQRTAGRGKGEQRRLDADRRRLAALHLRQGQGARRRLRPGRQDLWWDLVCRVAVRDGRHRASGERSDPVQQHEHVRRRPGRLRLLATELTGSEQREGLWSSGQPQSFALALARIRSVGRGSGRRSRAAGSPVPTGS